ncbi:hypothetical protein QQM79_03720 [Marinobacteraceae bacterium S3BR75-40.1]
MNSDTKVTREVLYQEIWEEPVQKVAPRYGISGVALRKICIKQKIPVPPRGYWAKVAAGKTPRRIPLSTYKGPELRPLNLQKVEAPSNEAHVNRSSVCSRQRIGDIKVPEELSEPHPLIKAASKRLRKRQGWGGPKGLRAAPSEVFHISTTRASLERALLIADTLIKELEKRGVEIQIEPAKSRSLVVSGKVSLPIQITEHVSRTRHAPTVAEKRVIERYRSNTGTLWKLEYPSIPEFDYHSTGKLTVTIDSYPGRNWRDTPKTPLEQRMHVVIAEALDLIELHRRKIEEEARRQRAYEMAKRRYESAIERRQTEQLKFDQLEADATNWRRAKELRGYIRAVQDRAKQEQTMTDELQSWIDWASLKADWLDPTIHLSDAILDAPEPERPGYFFSPFFERSNRR